MYTEELTGRLVDGEPEWVAQDGRTFIVGRRGQVWTGRIKDLANCPPHEAKGKDISLRDLLKITKGEH